ncbi:hypothetical protein AN1645.2 [Aspergillus nidulans FGSC A4]|uniref:Uncharacterized protein n=1 Tax=Emericella nidulans (strain FGSC A4 / ATCC 38163 / CBS 112.46 / NRRL 194 / M139) TaxID=227321 RepID=Q5BCT5_EMENI|nr:hypothetical protein [Aspergillus nidulans FGSC A4]EAA64765.1 hypothetical protein AN1645.2 [Aspergillus nidulans FGSC A4]CBF85284.1 TPA: conserved hypothetical protein [Aspergillus nidulans FGSC A4]|eukprot:XP_659249.1 hypothetical protein AN1645.2 [Aspergillus nidulans FGSC A4]
MYFNPVLFGLPAIGIIGHAKYACAGSDSCLDADGGSPHANFAICCTDRASGAGYIGNTKYDYICEAYATRNGLPTMSAKSAAECARRCDEDDKCVSGTWWSSNESCYRKSTSSSPQSNVWSREYVLLVESGKDSGPEPGPGPDCQQQVVDAIRTERETCSSKISAIVNDKNEKMKDQICEMLTRPKRDWSLLPVDMKHVDEVRKIVEFAGHASDTDSVAFAPDGNRFASGSADESVRFWDIKTQSSKELKGHTDKVSSVAFSSNGKYLASEISNSMIRIWDGETGQYLRQITGHTGAVRAVAFLQHGNDNILASASNDRSIKM